MSDYEHAGEWDCNGCGATFLVEEKPDVFAEALACPNHLNPVPENE